MKLSAPPFVIPHLDKPRSVCMPMFIYTYTYTCSGLGAIHCSTGGFPWDFPRGGPYHTTTLLCFLSSFLYSPPVYKIKEKIMSHFKTSGQCLARLSVSTCTQDLYSSKVAWGGLLTYPYLRHYWLTYSIDEDLRDFVSWVLSMCTYS